MSLQPIFQNRDFTNKLPNQRLEWVVNSMEWEAEGGCKEASLTAYGPELDLWELIEYLRCPVVIQDKEARSAWWGFVSEARVRVGVIEVGVTLASMANRVAVAYSYIAPGTQLAGQRKTTAWAEDAESVAEYGKKEWLSSASGLTDAGALARRDAILAAQKWPAGVTSQQGAGYPRGRVIGSGTDNSQRATLICAGWFGTLAWQYANWGSLTGPSYSTGFVSDQGLGTPGAQKVFQQITVGAAAINVLSIAIGARKFNSPTDNLIVSIYALDEAGIPTGSALTSASIAASSLTGSSAWYTLSVTECNLSANTMYGLIAERSGALDGTNYFTVTVNGAMGYGGGIFRIWNGSNWVNRIPPADMNFILNINDNIETTNQINDLALTFGEFLTGVDIDSASGVSQASFRNGDTTALEEIRAMMTLGGPNKRRYLAEVTETRRLHIWEEPAVKEQYYLNRLGELSDGRIGVIEYLPPAGVWIRQKDVIPASADTSKLTDPTLQFLEGDIWRVNEGLSFRFRGQPSIEDVMRLK